MVRRIGFCALASHEEKMSTYRKAARNKFNALLGRTGFQLVRPGERDAVRSFIPFRETLDGARKAGLSVGDYIDSKYHVPGTTQATVDQMAGFGVFQGKIDSICEIGPGSGRYLDIVQKMCAPHSYEIYETDPEWSNWLARTYHVIAREADGTSLRDTASGSMELVHAHKVFVYLPFVVTFQYFKEMVRVVRPGGQIVFDVVSDRCMNDETIEKWIACRTYSRCVIPRDLLISYFGQRGCALHASFLAPNLPGQSEYLIFVKDGT